ncbi:NADH dehydrogenase-like [Tropilaelaps mercedesae]|uniref:NADH dehydrogenase [ubiquinone] 1 beta subcomplex subunit 7 n=1 Tax=Tropilaelaps mercedesae TaxID=418985 RepID=A0A1V9XSV1_9ACAR|nr:NADH dehydrogenase-like [Tropilaelaps mercedesae]
MGNIPFGNLSTYGAWWGTQFFVYDPDGMVMPKPPSITHDPLEGFPNGRKPRVMIATKEEMMSAKIPLDRRDYCAHKLIDYKNCRYMNFPFFVNCRHEYHDYEQCEYDDYVLRLKEAERERRLRKRDELLARKQAEAAKNLRA